MIIHTFLLARLFYIMYSWLNKIRKNYSSHSYIYIYILIIYAHLFDIINQCMNLNVYITVYIQDIFM
jgi:hypothetical protein